jgi:hypothetical protein
MTKLTALRKTGKWGRDDYPQSGWQCVHINDHGAICEMCEVQKIVYVHVMVHEKLPGVRLDCGLVCAGHMRGDVAYAKLREGLFKWRYEASRNKTPIEKLRRKGWSGKHRSDGSHAWTLYDQAKAFSKGSFRVGVKDRDGWRFEVSRDWWDRRNESLPIHGGPFESGIEAALAGIEHAELLKADSEWMAADGAARAAHRAAFKAEHEAKLLDYAIREMTERGHVDLAEKLKCDGITISDAFSEQRRRSEKQAAE